MKLGHSEQKVRGNVNQSKSFGIANNAKMFGILSKGLYKEPILAIIRELSTNALDSHRAAGVDKPFDIHLPTIWQPVFYIRDYGTGLTAEELEEIYTCYGYSTKDDSNEAIGCFGLGSKTPFAYTDQLNVESFINGKHIICMMYLDGGEPKYQIISENATKEPNGLKISFSVKNSDCNAFIYNANRVYQYFDKKPNAVGAKFNIEPLEYIYEIDNVKVREGGTMQIVMGQVAYPVSYHDNQVPKHILHAMQYPLDIYVPIGTVSLIASREGIEYNLVTINKLMAVINDAITSLSEKISKDIAGAKDYAEAAELYCKYDYQLRNIVEKIGVKPVYNGLKIEGWCRTDCLFDVTKASVRKRPVSYNYATPQPMVWLDKEGTQSRAIQYLNDSHNQQGYILKTDDLPKFLSYLGMSDERWIVRASQLPPTPKKTRNVTKDCKTATFCNAYLRNSYGPDKPLDTTKTFYYIDKPTSDGVIGSMTHYSLYRIFSNLKELNVSVPTIYIVGKKVDKTHGIHLFKFLTDTLDTLKTQYPDWNQNRTLTNSYVQVNTEAILRYYSSWKEGKELYNFYKSQNGKSHVVRAIAQELDKNVGITTLDMSEVLAKKYPLLDFYGTSPEQIKHLVQYVKLIEKGVIV